MATRVRALPGRVAVACWCVLGLLGATPVAAVPSAGRLVSERENLDRVSVGGETRHALRGARVVFPVRLARGAVLRTAFAVDAEVAGKESGRMVEFSVALLHDGKRTPLFRRRSGGFASLSWSDIRFTLRPRSGGAEGEADEIVAEIELEGKAIRGVLPPESIVWAAPRIEPVARGVGPNLILLSIDTLRADHLGCYGYARDTSPNIDRLASEGVLFEHSIASSNWTLPSHASMLTGLDPSRHGAVRPGRESQVEERLEMVAELLWDHGYTTAAFTGHGLVRASLGFSQGFDRFEGTLDAVGSADNFGRKVEDALAWMEQVRGQRFFLFLHTYAVHMPFTPGPPYDEMFDPEYDGPYKGSFDNKDLRATDIGRGLSDRDLRHVVSLYDGGIAAMDATVGALLNGLRNQGLAQSTCLILTSDHGESFREHGELLHGIQQLYDETLRVPLIVSCPSEIGAPRRVDSLVASVDVAPTLLDLAGAAIPTDIDGRSLMPLLRGETDAVRDAAVSEVDAGVQWKEGGVGAVRTLRYKLTETMPGGRRQLFDLRDDPGETIDIARREPRVVKQLLKKLRAAQRDAVSTLERGGAAAPPAPTIDAATEERLRTLGYLP